MTTVNWGATFQVVKVINYSLGENGETSGETSGN
jgi:hypothetical protein